VTKTNPGRWLPGTSGNPNGRPLGARTEFSVSFMRDMARVWAARGGDIIEKVAADDPSRFFAVASTLIPKDVAISIEQRLPGGLSPSDLAIFQAIREAIPGANEMQPTQVLEHTLNALRAYGAIEISPDVANVLPNSADDGTNNDKG
jgi:hypothetical protein